MYCKECGKEVVGDAKFCGNCGASQDGSVQAAKSGLDVNLLVLESKKKSFAITIIAGLICPGAGYMYAGSILWGVISLIGFILFFFAIDPFLAGGVSLLAVLGGVLQADRYNKKLIADSVIDS